MSNRVNEFTTLDARHRIYAELLRLSRPDAAKPAQALVSPPPAHADLAARVSIRRESVTRELKALLADLEVVAFTAVPGAERQFAQAGASHHFLKDRFGDLVGFISERAASNVGR